MRLGAPLFEHPAAESRHYYNIKRLTVTGQAVTTWGRRPPQFCYWTINNIIIVCNFLNRHY